MPDTILRNKAKGTSRTTVHFTPQPTRPGLGHGPGLKLAGLNEYKNQRGYLAIPVSDIKGLMILKNVLSC